MSRAMRWRGCWMWMFAGVLATGYGLLEAEPKLEAGRTMDRELAKETFERAWEIINESFYDTNFHGVNWEKTREDLLPKAEASETTEGLRRIIQEMIDRLKQSHMRVIPGELATRAGRARVKLPPVALAPMKGGELLASSKWGQRPKKSERGDAAAKEEQNESGAGRAEVGLDCRLVGDQLLVVRVDPGLPAEEAGVRPGWVIERIGDESIPELIGALPRRISTAERSFLGWRIGASGLLGSPGSAVAIDFRNGAGKRIHTELKRVLPPGEPIKLGHLPELYSEFESKELRGPNGAGIGYIRFNLFMLPVASLFDKAMDKFRQEDGMIIDLRGNLGGIGGMIMGLSGYFFDEPVSLGTMKMRGADLKIPANPRRLNSRGENVGVYQGPLAILIDGLSLSAAEIFAGGIQEAGRARVFGERSGGQALPALWDQLPNGDVLYHAFADFITPRGIRLEGRGVIPDVEAKYDRRELLGGRDVALEKAVAWLSEKKAEKGDH